MYKTAAAQTCVLGINQLPQSFLHSTCRLWITDKAPSLNHWLQTVTSIIPFEVLFSSEGQTFLILSNLRVYMGTETA